jgi:outer membrane protein insertion porin family
MTVFSMREAAGQSLKSAISHSWMRDTRDNPIAATRGLYTKFYQEIAGLGGDASFYKVEAEGQLSRNLFRGSVRFCQVYFCIDKIIIWFLSRERLFLWRHAPVSSGP